MEEFLKSSLKDSFNLTLRNTKSTHFNFSYNTWSTLDFVFSSAQISNQLFVQYHIDLAGSDHIPLLTYQSTTAPAINPLLQTNFHKINWDKYAVNCRMQVPHLADPSTNPEKAIGEFSEVLIQIALHGSPQVFIKQCLLQRRTVPWWTAECTKALQDRRRALRILRKNKNLEALSNSASVEQEPSMCSSKPNVDTGGSSPLS